MPPIDDTHAQAMWTAINDLRSGQAENKVMLAESRGTLGEIKTLLSERCDARLKRIEDLEDNHEKHEREVHGKLNQDVEELKRTRWMLEGAKVLAASIAGFVAAYIGKSHG